MVSCGIATLMILSAALAEAPPAADGPVRIEIDGAAGFTASELEQALMARLSASAPKGTLRVVAHADGSIELSWQSRRRVVNLGGDSGPAAARIAALLAADLLQPFGLPISLAPSPTSAPLPAGPTSMAESRLQLAASYQVWTGAWAGPLLQGAELAAQLDRDRLRLRASAGYLSGEGNSIEALTAWPLRLGAGLGATFGALLGNVVMVPYRMEGLVHVTRALVGLGLQAQARIPLAAGLAAEASAGYEVYVNRRAEIWAGSRQLFAMPASAFRFGLGISWGHAR